MNMTNDHVVRFAHHVARGFTHMEHPFHMTYLGLVFFEGHSLYAYAAGGLFVVTGFNYLTELIDFFGREG